jgi:hypothetical protein
MGRILSWRNESYFGSLEWKKQFDKKGEKRNKIKMETKNAETFFSFC